MPGRLTTRLHLIHLDFSLIIKVGIALVASLGRNVASRSVSVLWHLLVAMVALILTYGLTFHVSVLLDVVGVVSVARSRPLLFLSCCVFDDSGLVIFVEPASLDEVSCDLTSDGC